MTGSGGARRAGALRVALVLLLVGAASAAQARGPEPLFPDLAEPPPSGVDALPLEPPREIAVEPLAATGLDARSIADPVARVLGPAPWSGAEPTAVDAALGGLPIDTPVPELRRLVRGVLAAPAPIGEPDGERLARRVDTLARAGDEAAARTLLGEAGDATATLERLAIELALDLDEGAAACARAGPERPVDAFWTRLRIWCALRDGNRAGAKLLAELNPSDRSSFDAAAARMIAADGGGRVETGPAPSALDLAMVRLARAALVVRGDPAASARLLRALTAGASADPADAAAAAQAAGLRGLIEPQETARIWQGITATLPDPALQRRVATLRGLARAAPDALSGRLREAWRGEPQGPFRPFWARLLRPWIDALPPAAVDDRTALDLAEIALAAGSVDLAAAYRERARVVESVDTDGRAERQAERIALALALAGRDVGTGLPGSPEGVLAEPRARLALVLASAAGIELGPAWGEAVAPAPWDDAPAVTLARAIAALDQTARGGEPGAAGDALVTLDVLGFVEERRAISRWLAAAWLL